MRNFRRIPLGLLLVAALAALAWGSDPWKAKPYQQWDQKDVEKILNDSPWAQTESVTASWRSGSMTSNPVMRTQGSGSVAGGSAMGAPAGLGMTPHEQSAKFVARWVSALTMREALARKAVLDGQLAQTAAGKDIAQAPSDYQITLLGDDMTPFSKLDEAAIASDSYIEMKKAKEKLAPSSVKITRSPDGSKVIFVVFNFPKTVGGKPAIGPDEKGIDFICKVKHASLRFHFDPRKMEGKQGPDL
jgi:hypothetical protein